jgi:hypothetical protein
MAAEDTIFNQGDTLDWTLPLQDANGDAVNLNDLLGYAVFLYDSKGKIVKKYSNNELDGFENTLEADGDAAEGMIRMINEASHTRLLKGEIFREIKVQVTNNDYENNRWSGSTKREYLMTINEDSASQFTSLATLPSS